MTAPTPRPDERLETEALVTDRYLDALLAAGDRHAQDAPADASLDPILRRAARLLRRDLVRVHPSFRFEERLAARLAEAAAATRLPAAAGAEGAVVPVAPLADAGDAAGLGPDEAADPGHPNQGLPRPLLIGGALTSAAIAGAAYVAWRRTRPPLGPMARAVRAARGTRLELRRTRVD